MKTTCTNKGDRVLLAILLYERFIRPNIQFLITQQRAYQSFLFTSWFDSYCVAGIRRVNFREKIHEFELQLFGYNV